MADKNPYAENLAVAVHRAERAYGEALAAPAGADRIERINRATVAVSEAEAAYDHCTSGRAYSVPVKR